jgi:hypothetical protein
VPRDFLEIPLDELAAHFTANQRQDIKIVVPAMLAGPAVAFLRRRGAKPELLLEGSRWTASPPDAPNLVCESREFALTEAFDSSGPFTLSFANAGAEQEEHSHAHHIEIYYSEHPITGHYRRAGEDAVQPIRLNRGGLLVFGPGLIHRVRLSGITVVIEVPAVQNDKTTFQS